MSDQIEERVARAIYERKHGHLKNCWGWDDSGLDDEHPGARRNYINTATAAIKEHTAALAEGGYVIVPREPTEAMVDVVYGAARPWPVSLTRLHAEKIWKAMIEARPKS